ncbi:unnamed protein product, partial [Brachionus calyciflorus]
TQESTLRTQLFNPNPNQFPIGGYGPIGTSNQTVQNDSSPCVDKIIKDHNRTSDSANLPLLINNLDSDNEVHQILKKSPVNPYCPIVWQNINNLSVERFNHFVKNILPANDQYLFTVNGKCLEYKFAKQIQHSLKTKDVVDRILLGTDSPHYPANYFGKQYSTPLHIANMVLEMHLILVKSNDFKHLTLADTNDLFTSNAFSVFPKRVFQNMNRRSFDNFVRLRLNPTLSEYKAHIKYFQPIIAKSTSSKRSNTTATFDLENMPPLKKTFLNTEVQTSQMPPTTSRTEDSDETILPDISLTIHDTKSNSIEQSILDTIDLTTDEDEPLTGIAERAKRIRERALTIISNSTSWQERGASKIQVVKIPKSLVRRLAHQSENMSDQQFDEFIQGAQ